jgi:hypothetical protein
MDNNVEDAKGESSDDLTRKRKIELFKSNGNIFLASLRDVFVDRNMRCVNLQVKKMDESKEEAPQVQKAIPFNFMLDSELKGKYAEIRQRVDSVITRKFFQINRALDELDKDILITSKWMFSYKVKTLNKTQMSMIRDGNKCYMDTLMMIIEKGVRKVLNEYGLDILVFRYYPRTDTDLSEFYRKLEE